MPLYYAGEYRAPPTYSEVLACPPHSSRLQHFFYTEYSDVRSTLVFYTEYSNVRSTLVFYTEYSYDKSTLVFFTEYSYVKSASVFYTEYSYAKSTSVFYTEYSYAKSTFIIIIIRCQIWNRHWRPCLSKHLCHQTTSTNLNPYFVHLLAKLQRLSRNVILCLPLSRLPSTLPVKDKNSKPLRLHTCPKNSICLSLIVFNSDL